MRSPNVDWSFLPAIARPGQHGAYIVRDAHGTVLYVGQTNDLQRRIAKGHRYRSAWFAEMDSVEFLPCDGLTEARALEKALIAEHRPAANINDVLTPRRPKRPLPERHVARLVELHEAYSAAPLLRRDDERAALEVYIAQLRADGWTYSSIGHPLHMTRQAIQKRRVQLLAQERAA